MKCSCGETTTSHRVIHCISREKGDGKRDGETRSNSWSARTIGDELMPRSTRHSFTEGGNNTRDSNVVNPLHAIIRFLQRGDRTHAVTHGGSNCCFGVNADERGAAGQTRQMQIKLGLKGILVHRVRTLGGRVSRQRDAQHALVDREQIP